MIFDKYINNNCIEESVKGDINEANSVIEILFLHMLKFVYQPNRQDVSWYNSILDSHIYINNIKNINVINGIDLDSCYLKGRKKAIKQTGLGENIFPKQRPSEWDYNFISNSDKIINFLEENYCSFATYNIPKNQIKYIMNDKISRIKYRQK